MISPEHLPSLPGCYILRDEAGSVLYVGKAKDLRRRVGSYLSRQEQDPKTEALIQAARSVDFIVTNNEVEALLLENTLIKRHWPRYNVKLKDSSRYAGILLTEEAFPRICLARKPEGKGRFFGPFTSARERDRVFQVVRKTFGLRTCRRIPKRPCLRYHLGHCCGPCTGSISGEEYGERVKRAEAVLSGRIEGLIASLQSEMQYLSARQEYERARELRDEILSLERLLERQSVDHWQEVDQDVLCYRTADDMVCLMLFKVHSGSLEEKEEFVFPWSSTFLEEFLVQYYTETRPPDELILAEPLEVPLVDLLAHLKGGRVRITVPRRGKKRMLLELAEKNLEVGFFSEQRRLEALQQALHLPGPPEVIECFDISHLAGSDTVGSMVQFRGGRPDKSGYRRFRIRSVEGIDDLACMAEVVRRRYSRRIREGGELPDLIIIDGGQGQLASAARELEKLDLRIPVISIAKRMEEIYLPGMERPVEVDERARLLVQEVRDEAHRFALSYHRLLRRKAIREGRAK
ncbi:MAG: excinuclease ABC subunit UvrC [Methanothrix sp.]|nr:excinuclease ABC subunit UvrC [Methanothrix sp.]